MKQLVFLFLVESFVALSLSAIQPYHGSFGDRKQPLLKSFEGFKYDVKRGPDGEYEFSYHAGDSYRKESRTSSGLVQGEFAFVAPEGDEYDFKYEADKNGYRVKGDALPLKPEETEEVKQAKEKFFEEYEKVLERTEDEGNEEDDSDDEEEDEDSEEDDDEDDDEESSEESSEEDDDEEDDEDSEVDPAKYAIYARYGFSPKSLSESSEESSEEDDDDEDDDDEEEEEEEEGNEEEGNEEEGNEEGNEEEGNEEEVNEEEAEAETNVNKEQKASRGNPFSKKVSVQRNVRKLDGINQAVFAHFGKRIPKAIYVRRAK